MRYPGITASLLVAALMVGGPALAGKDKEKKREEERAFTLKKVEWNAKKQRLEVKLRTDKDTEAVRLTYGGRTYDMRRKKPGEFVYKQDGACYDAALEIVTSGGDSASAAVKVKDGSPEGRYCRDGLDNGDGGGDSGNPAGGGSARDLVVLASNDLGMHCACPGTEFFMLLPPFNTLRAQVVERGEEPRVLGAGDGISVRYSMVENTDESLKNDPYYAVWLENMPKYGFGPGVDQSGRVRGVSGAGLSGEMTPVADGWWEVEGVPAFPDIENSPLSERVMKDSLGGPDRNPYPTAKIEVFDSESGDKLAEATTVVPVAFGGCCDCHLKVTKDRGMAPTPANSFKLMGRLHERDSGINFAEMDPDGDGVPGPIRCSACHLDPAMGETAAPGYPGLPTSKYTFSNVLHRWHAQSPEVLRYDPDIATDCYACHPGNNVGCFRGLHADKGMWCTDCHGDLNERVAEGQVDNPWSPETLPKCEDCHQGTGEGEKSVHAFGGAFLNSMGHKDNKILCSSCHGAPHALYPAARPQDNAQALAVQGDEAAIGNCGVCHTDQGDTWGVPPHADAIPSLRSDAGGGSQGGGASGGVDPASELRTTCLACHGDKGNKVACGNAKWTAHRASRVSAAVYDAVSRYLTGGTCP